MSNSLYFDECKDCLFEDCKDDLMICLTNRLRIPFRRLGKELPIVGRHVDPVVGCHGFMRRISDG